jgi:hypothetical protein
MPQSPNPHSVSFCSFKLQALIFTQHSAPMQAKAVMPLKEKWIQTSRVTLLIKALCQT